MFAGWPVAGLARKNDQKKLGAGLTSTGSKDAMVAYRLTVGAEKYSLNIRANPLPE
jgi:hypothetical protein